MKDTFEPAEFVIRPMDLDDIPQVHAIDQLSFSLPWPERSFRYEMTENPTSRQWVAEAVGANGVRRVVGLAILWLVLDEIHIGTFAVHPDFRRRGVARQLLARSLLAARTEGATHAYLEVRRGNIAAQKLYESFGFHLTGVRQRYYKNNGEDALLMDLDKLDTDSLIRFSAHQPALQGGEAGLPPS